jgi:hypothetical protein
MKSATLNDPLNLFQTFTGTLQTTATFLNDFRANLKEYISLSISIHIKTNKYKLNSKYFIVLE